ncbi:phage tail-collar fiber domain-containing protein [Klebsiella aerogenes]
MTAKYYAILTNQGAARLANATALGTKLNLTQMAVGDASGKLPTPDPAQTALINQQRIAPLNMLTVDPANASQIIAEQIIPENEGGFWIREIGLYDDDGVLIAVANCPETYKPKLAEGSGRTQTIRMILIVSSTTAITLKIDPSVVLATRKYVDDVIEAHAKSRNHPDATTKEKGLVQLSSATNSDSETLAATPKAVKAVKAIADAAVKSVDGNKPDAAGSVDTGRGDSTQAVIAIPPIPYLSNSYIKIATIKDCGPNSAYFQITVFGTGNYGKPGQNIEKIAVSCRGVANMTAANVDTYIQHKATDNGANSMLRVVAAPAATPGAFDILLNATGGWWSGVRMRVESIAGSEYIVGPVIDRKMGVNAWTTINPANSFTASRQIDLTDASIGTSGAKIPLLNAENTWSKTQKISNASLTITADSAVARLQSSGGNSVLFFQNQDSSERAAIYSGMNTTTTASLCFRAKTTTGVSAGQMELKSDGSLAVPGNTTVKGMVKPTNYSNFDDRYLLRSQDLPVGIPLPWSTATAPNGWLKCNGATFDKAKYPGLASAYPSGKLPDLRGEFIRGLDDGRGVDAGRAVLSSQGDAVQKFTGKTAGIQHYIPGIPLEGVFARGDLVASTAGLTSVDTGDGVFRVEIDASLQIRTAAETRPRNIAFNYIVRAA